MTIHCSFARTSENNMTKTDASSSEKILSLEGIRGIASWMVVLGHLFNVFFPVLTISYDDFQERLSPTADLALKSPLNILYAAEFAVCIFFVHSGFVLSLKYFNKPQSVNKIFEDSFKRYFRLMPVVAFSVLLSFVFYKFKLYQYRPNLPWQNSWYSDHFKSTHGFLDVLNQMFVLNFFNLFSTSSESLNTSLWTILVEFRSSFIVFSLMYLYFWGLPALVAGALIAGYYLFPDISFGFIVGVATSFVYSKFTFPKVLRKYRETLSWILFIAGVFIASLRAEIPGYPWHDFLLDSGLYDVVSITGATAILVAVLNSKALSNFFTKKIFIHLGELSYSVYAVHIPLLFACAPMIFTFAFNKLRLGFISSLLILITCFAFIVWIVAMFTRKFIDLPSIGWSNRIKDLPQKSYLFLRRHALLIWS